jgi:hypothetical protein
MNTKILLPGVVTLAGSEYRKIPGYVSAYAGINSQIALIKSNGEVYFPKPFEWKTTKGTYKYVTLVTDDFVQVKKAVHQLVCKAFHGDPPVDGRRYEPNHKDSDKHNNKPDNLEWMTRSENVQYGFDSGNNQAGLRIDVTNIKTGETVRYSSLSALARIFGLQRYQLRDIIAKHRNIPWNGEYVFVIDDESDKKLNRHQSRPIVFRDYVSNQVTVTSSAQEASDLTGVKVGTIVLRTRELLNNLDREETLHSKFIFRPATLNKDWPKFTKEEALASEKLYHSR